MRDARTDVSGDSQIFWIFGGWWPPSYWLYFWESLRWSPAAASWIHEHESCGRQQGLSIATKHKAQAVVLKVGCIIESPEIFLNHRTLYRQFIQEFLRVEPRTQYFKNFLRFWLKWRLRPIGWGNNVLNYFLYFLLRHLPHISFNRKLEGPPPLPITKSLHFLRWKIGCTSGHL